MWLYKILNLYPQNLTHGEVCWIVWRGKKQQLSFEVQQQISTITTQNKPVHWAIFYCRDFHHEAKMIWCVWVHTCFRACVHTCVHACVWVCAKRQRQVSFLQMKLVLLILGPVLELSNSVLELYSLKMNLENALKSGATRDVAQSLPNMLDDMSLLLSIGQTRYGSAHLSVTWAVLAGDSQVQGQPKLNETLPQERKEIRVREEPV